MFTVIYLKKRKLIAKTVRKYGKMAGTVGGPANAKALMDEGFNFINIGADVIALGQYFKNVADSVSNI